MSSVTINGHTYTDDNNVSTGMGAGGHRTRLIPMVSDIVTVAAQVAANTATVALNKANTDTNNTVCTAKALEATSSAVAAAASAEEARAIVGIPPAYDSLVMQPNRIDTDMTVPDGFNAVMFGDFELHPDATLTCLGNSTFIAIG